MTELAAYRDVRLETTLAFALRLNDGFTGCAPVGRIDLKLDNVRVNVPRNRSGYWLFLDLPLSRSDGSAASYRLEVAAEFYFPLVQPSIRPRELDRLFPVVTADLMPLPAYPFAPGNTLLRGMVQDLVGQPIAGATVEIRQSTVRGQTTAKGEFVLFFRRMTPDDVELVGGRRLLVVQNSTNLRLRARHADFRSRTLVLQVEEAAENGTAGPIQLRPI
jgi:hypothetical protein